MNSFERDRQKAKMYKEMYPAGTRIELISMGNDPQPIDSGTRGTVDYVDDIGQIGMKWDNGRSLSLIPSEDSFRKLTPKEIEAEGDELLQGDDVPVQTM
ncbi:MAG TPA: hypothetical protein DEP23_11135 [Ruminococcaceae bacterium]|nr:hypothetical protein [Oscillospiraceae bacterium]